MGSNTPNYDGFYQKLAAAAREMTRADAAALSRFDPKTLLIFPLALAPLTKAFPPDLYGRPVRADASLALRRAYLQGRPVSVHLPTAAPGRRKRMPEPSASGRKHTATRYVTILPLRCRGGIAGTLSVLTAAKPAPRQLRRYASVAQLLAQVFELAEDAREAIDGGERARRDAAAVLHGTQAALMSVRYRLGESQAARSTDPQRADALVEQSREQLQRIGEQDIGEVGRSLYPLAIRMGLTPALEALVERYTSVMKVRLHIDPAVAKLDDPFRNELPERLRLAIYRLAEAALAHAAARPPRRALAVTLMRSDEATLRLTVAQRANAGEAAEEARAQLGSLEVRLHEWNGTLRLMDGRGSLSASFALPAQNEEAGRSPTRRSPV
jgi:hypothetical protein